MVFTITPYMDAELSDVSVDGGSIGLTNSYTFTNLAADHTIQATFTIDPDVPSGDIKYVDVAQTTGLHDGSSWDNAFSNLVNALSAAGPGNLYVAKGTYSPGTSTTDYFRTEEDLSLYGGFTNGMASFHDRDWEANATILDGGRTNFHVVYCTHPIIFDGFIVQNGQAGPPAETSASTRHGGGWYGDGGATIRNCTFRYNTTEADGCRGGGMYLPGGSQWIENCLFINNTNLHTSLWSGGGAIAFIGSSATVTNCRFFDNSAGKSGGALFSYSGTPTIVDCIFRGNRGGTYGGAIGHYRQSNPTWTISNCTFIANTAVNYGGAFGHYGGGTFAIDDCTFVSNGCGNSGSAVYFSDYQLDSPQTTGMVRNCRFSGNSAPSGWAALHFNIGGWGGTGRVANCEFYGNAGQYCGGVSWADYGTGSVANCLFVGNYGQDRGGGINLIHGLTTLENVTVYGNYSANGGGILNRYNGQSFLLKNSIVWGNMSSTAGESNIANFAAGATIAYTAVGGGFSGIGGDTAMTDGGGLLGGDPLFALNVDTNTWTANGQYDTITGQTTLTRALAGWTANAFKGMAVHPDVNEGTTSLKYLQYLVASNDTDTIWAWGDCSALAVNGDTYAINDFHVKSREGRYTPGGWVIDTEHSPCVDAGDRTSAYALEPSRHGERINMGAYGNTGEASKSILTKGSLFMIR